MIDVKVGEFVEFCFVDVCQETLHVRGTVRSVTEATFTVAVQYWRSCENAPWRKAPRTGGKLPLQLVRKYGDTCRGLGLEYRWQQAKSAYSIV